MKKILTLSALFLTIPVFLTGCGDKMGDNTSNDGYYSKNDYSSEHDNKVKDDINSAADGVSSAADDIIEGAEDAVSDVIDGIDGDNSVSSTARSTDR